MTNEEIRKYLYEKVLIGTNEESIKKFDSLPENDLKQKIRVEYCNWLVDILTKNFIKHELDKIDLNEVGVASFLNNCAKLSRDNHFYFAFSHLLKREYKQFKEEMHLYIQSIDFSTEPLSEAEFANWFLIPFKNAFDGFWKFIGTELNNINVVSGIAELCPVLELYYNSKNNEEVLEIMLKYIQHFPESQIVNELIAYTYLSMNMWSNAIAYFERIDNGVFFYYGEIQFLAAWCYGKTKNHAEEERCYREANEWCLEYDIYREYLLNNLGYCLYQQKKYNEAKEVLFQCIKANLDYPNSAYNYIRTLLALGQYEEAKKFIDETDCKISKSFKDRVEKGLAKKAKNKNSEPAVPDILEEDTAKVPMKDIGIKREQFTNEKLLEDELTARIESGIPVFGLNLKIYKRRGEYGRQYIIPVGRLDLLCEDDKGNLYVIELKKDSGYDDAYKQTAEYLDWFAQSEKFSGKTVNGIICLNNPSAELISKVHKDSRMRLFEYQISYTER